MSEPTCSVAGCNGVNCHRGICDLHRFERHYSIDSVGCWVWHGDTGTRGYGIFHSEKKDWRAHRWAYERHIGQIPEGLVIDHLCRNTRCVNPEHLEAVTQRENILRGTAPAAIHARQTSCKNGHDLTPGAFWLSKEGWRMCKRCDYDRKARRTKG